MALLAVVPSSAMTRSGSFFTALLFGCWACLVVLGLRRILAGAPGSSPRAWSWPLLSPRRSTRRLERQVLRDVARHAVLDPGGGRLLPNHVEVLLGPSELRALGPLADQVAESIAHAMLELARRRGDRLPADPEVILAAAPDGPGGRPVVRAGFGRPATTRRATATTRPAGARPPDGAGAVLRRLEPPGRPLLLGGGHVRLGRRPECDLAVPDPGVSRRHASLHWRVAGWYLIDHGSTNGTFVNGNRVRAPARLADGDEIQLGRRVRLRFEHRHLRSA